MLLLALMCDHCCLQEKDESKQVWEDLHQLREKYRERRRKELNSERNNFSDRGGGMIEVQL